MTILVLLYITLLMALAFRHSSRNGDYRDYVAAGARQGTALVMLSMLATMVGGSATVGMVDMTARIGFPAIWWLGVGVVGLLLQALLLSGRVRALNALTLPDVAALTVGNRARTLIALVIVLSWTGVVAAQLTALSQICSAMTGLADPRGMLVTLTVAVIVYTALGGQISVLRTDAFQLVVIAGGIAATVIFLYASTSTPLPEPEWFNAAFRPMDAFQFMLVVGATFFIGPDIFSRAFTAKNGATARRATLGAAMGLAAFAMLLVLLGCWAKANGMTGSGVLSSLIRETLPMPVALLLGFGLISAFLSSADTCLMSAATIVEHDLIRGSSRDRVRLFVVLFGLAALGIALFRSDIIRLLLGAYAVYAPGVVPPLFVAIMSYKRIRPNENLWLLAVAVGGGFGLWGAVSGWMVAPMLGMLFSTVLAIGSLAGAQAPARKSQAPAQRKKRDAPFL